MRERPNILILGASGGVAGAFLQRLARHRRGIGNLVLVDRNSGVQKNEAIAHEDLGYEFIGAQIDVKHNPKAYTELLREKTIDVVVDLSINETRVMLALTDAQHACYVNTGIANLPGENFAEVVLDIYRRKDRSWRVPHILCAGMNPGIVNMWVRHGIDRFGVPDEVIHFEYDTAQPVNDCGPIITWSRETFLDEIVNDPAGYMEGRDKVRNLYPNPLKHRICMEDVLRPVLKADAYPCGFLLLHEENITIAQSYDIPSRFLFAMDMKTMNYLESVYDAQGRVPLETLTLGDNKEVMLKGSVTIGVRLEYEDRYVIFYNTTSHENRVGSSGSCWQVAAGLEAALTTLVADPLEPRVYFVEDLAETTCRRAVWENLRAEQMTVERSASGAGRVKCGGE